MPMIEELLTTAIVKYNQRNDELRIQMKGRAIVPTWDGLPYYERLIVLDTMIGENTPCFNIHRPEKIEYYIGVQENA